MSSYQIIGIMSGTSMDGVDIVISTYQKSFNKDWEYNTKLARSTPYPPELLIDIQKSINMSPTELLILDKKIGSYFANLVNELISESNIDKDDIDAIASHGHTIFHQPENGFTYQIGCGETLSMLTGINVINDFRQKDVVSGGQGAPLVPIGDLLLFNNLADAFLNIGGFSNICFTNNEVIAYDICPGNLPLNRIMNEIGFEYDKDGELSRKGIVIEEILEELNNLDYYSNSPPKSLGAEWLISNLYPITDTIFTRENRLCTITEHIAIQIAKVINQSKAKITLITGGGAKNNFLIERINQHIKSELLIPEVELIDFKEAIVFGFLGVLYLEKQPNSLSSVTGAKQNTIGGVLHTP